MPHAQQQVLEAIKSVLAGGGTDAGPRVFLDRVDALQSNELPAITIDEAADGETITPATIDNLEERALGVSIACVVAHGSSAAADARALGLQVEKLLTSSPPLAALCKLGVRIESSRIVISGEGDRLLAAREQSWRMAYMVAADSPDLIL